MYSLTIMKLKKYLLSGALLAFAANAGMAQIMPWENRTENDDSPFAETSGIAKKAVLF